MDLPKLALSIRQPWAWAIVHGGKDIENRDWVTNRRGPICIHASKGMTSGEYQNASRFIAQTVRGIDDAWLSKWHGACAAPYKLERGGIIGTAEIVGCVIDSTSPWFFGRFGFVLANVTPVDFIPCKGALGFFKWDATP
jgi:hypothetical protein